ncbi:MAG: hypothetical protein Q8N96_00095 [Methylovulum sp.]|nr:hypothetical protein [Methylovulum sp.]
MVRSPDGKGWKGHTPKSLPFRKNPRIKPDDMHKTKDMCSEIMLTSALQPWRIPRQKDRQTWRFHHELRAMSVPEHIFLLKRRVVRLRN